MEYRLNKEDLFRSMTAWNGFLKKKVHLIACGGTAMTLLGVKESTRDVDFLVPVEAEYRYLLKTLEQLGYVSASGHGWKRPGELYIFDLFRGKSVFTTELLDSPLDHGRHTLIKELTHLYIGVLNHEDLIISKIFRCSSVDVEDCVMLLKSLVTEVDIAVLKCRFQETAKYDITEEKMLRNWDHFERILRKEGFYGQ
ncbi:MAG: DUF6036 family nucleotidyltransferase [Candidatus Omnitrophota bacterium]